jgi:hypothetical protein
MILVEDRSGGIRAVQPRLWDLVAVRLFGNRLDTELARGASPDRDVRLALRARMLVSPRCRAEFAASVQRLATHRPISMLSATPRARTPELNALRALLDGSGPVSVRAMATVSLLLGDAANGLYAVGPAQPALRRLLTEALP